jgi:hypothetical protein
MSFPDSLPLGQTPKRRPSPDYFDRPAPWWRCGVLWPLNTKGMTSYNCLEGSPKNINGDDNSPFMSSGGPKNAATEHLHLASRKMKKIF